MFEQESSAANRPPPGSIIALVACLFAAWTAGGSIGAMSPVLQRAGCWLGMAVALVAAWPRLRCLTSSAATPLTADDEPRSSHFLWMGWLIGAVLAGIAITVSAAPAVRTLAPAVVLAALAHLRRGNAARVLLLGSVAIGVLGVYRLSLESSASLWLLVDGISGVIGDLVGFLTGRALAVGPSFAGFDFLVPTAVLLAGWLAIGPPGKLPRAVALAVTVLAAQAVYWMFLAHADAIREALPPRVLPAFTEISHLGVWSWADAARSLLPWNLPLLAAGLQAAVVAGVFAWGTWPPGEAQKNIPPVQDPPGTTEDRRARKKLQGGPRSLATVPQRPTLEPREAMLRAAPPLVALAAAMLLSLTTTSPSLSNRTIVAFDNGANWSRPTADQPPEPGPAFGMLREVVESLGSRFVYSRNLSAADLERADALLIVPPTRGDSSAYCRPEQLETLWRYVNNGGTLLVAAYPESHLGAVTPRVNELLAPTAIRVCDDTARSLTAGWEENLLALPQPATVGLDSARGEFGLRSTASLAIAWPAQPILVGRWGWSQPGGDATDGGPASSMPGERLGDLVLAAQQRVGAGRVVVLGDAACLDNAMLPISHSFAAQLLGDLASPSPTPQSPWRQFFGLTAAVALVTLIVWRPAPLRLMTSLVVLAVVAAGCVAAGDAASRFPFGGVQSPRPIAYIDASHLGNASTGLWSADGVGEFSATLARCGFLPLVVTDLSRQRLDNASMLVSLGPMRSFTGAERREIRAFVEAGGLLVNMVGAPEAEPSRELLADFGLRVAPENIPPSQEGQDNAPVGSATMRFQIGSKDHNARLYAGWPVEMGRMAGENDAQAVMLGPKGAPVIVSRTVGQGQVVLIGDTDFAANKNMEPEGAAPSENALFWRWLFERLGVIEPTTQAKIELPAAVEGGMIDISKPRLNRP